MGLYQKRARDFLSNYPEAKEKLISLGERFYRFLAKDSDGAWFAYAHEPLLKASGFLQSEGKLSKIVDSDFLQQLEKYSHNRDWKNTLMDLTGIHVGMYTHASCKEWFDLTF